MKMHFASALRIAAVVAGSVLGSQSTFAAITVTAEAPGVQQSQQSGVTTETFDGMSTGSHPVINSAIGTYVANPNAVVEVADQYGGANGTKYLALGNQSGGPGTVTLSLTHAADYFGLWWSAIDAQNTLQIYSGGTSGTLLGTYTSAILSTLIPGLSASGYDGNPNYTPKPNMHEKYAYINFFADAGTSFDTIVFTNGPGTGFESDNHSVRSVPEPSALLMGGAASIIGLAVARRRARKA